MKWTDPVAETNTDADYYLRMAAYHDAMALACRLSAAAATLTPMSSAEDRAKNAAADRARAETYQGLADSYRRMAVQENLLRAG
jgi:hypothetical protein